MEKLTGRKIYKKLPFGNDPLRGILYTLKNYKFNIIFDVGANTGQSAELFSKRFPNAKIYCFEPFSATF